MLDNTQQKFDDMANEQMGAVADTDSHIVPPEPEADNQALPKGPEPVEYKKAALNTSDLRGAYIGSYKSQSLSMITVPNSLVIIAGLALSLVVITALLMTFVPWQQSISGRGKVIIFSPMERPQHIQAPIPGRIKKWFVRDGQVVEKGDPIVELEEVDSKFLAPNQLEQLTKHKKALENQKVAAQKRCAALESQLGHLRRSKTAAVGSAGRKRNQTYDKLEAAEQAVTLAQQNLKTSELNYKRRKTLFDKGLRSKRDFELSELDLVKSRTSLEQALARLDVATKETSVAQFELSKTDADTTAKLHSIEASYSSARETIAKAEASIQKINIEISHLNSRICQRMLLSPCHGKVVRLLKAGAGETVKAGTQLSVVAPNTNDIAAELLLDGNDAPLVTPGRHVRLQFAGWPAVQFTGWPSVAVGTFAGKVAVVDAVDNGTGKFRIIVVPDKDAVVNGKDEDWPSTRFLRPGSEVHGWVMLNTVSLGFELWRQFNAFPPTIEDMELKSKSGDIKRNTK